MCHWPSLMGLAPSEVMHSVPNNKQQCLCTRSAQVSSCLKSLGHCSCLRQTVQRLLMIQFSFLTKLPHIWLRFWEAAYSCISRMRKVISPTILFLRHCLRKVGRMVLCRCLPSFHSLQQQQKWAWWQTLIRSTFLDAWSKGRWILTWSTSFCTDQVHQVLVWLKGSQLHSLTITHILTWLIKPLSLSLNLLRNLSQNHSIFVTISLDWALGWLILTYLIVIVYGETNDFYVKNLVS